MQETRLKALIELKSLQLRPQQQILRQSIAREHQLLGKCHPEVLMDWGFCRLADPDATDPDMSFKEPTPAIPVPQISQTAQLELTRYSKNRHTAYHRPVLSGLLAKHWHEALLYELATCLTILSSSHFFAVPMDSHRVQINQVLFTFMLLHVA